ncbi:hypothetical protein HanPSC8_Chr14g0597511 [Helianthus annuus]|nr:hypothetical protein HanPSC8_Chr14g0597511 [Helianthus annuus]
MYIKYVTNMVLYSLLSFCRFSNQGTATRSISSNLISLWSGPWDSWRDVPNEHRTRLFERFQVCVLRQFLFNLLEHFVCLFIVFFFFIDVLSVGG